MKIHLLFFIMIAQYCFAQSQKSFEPCRKAVAYTVDDWTLRKKVGMDLALPNTNPEIDGGIEKLKRYFAVNPLKNTKSFRTLIGFVVNCNGQAGNFQIVSDGKGELVALSEQVLELLKKMPLKWKPATSKEGKAVDSHYAIHFSVVKGKFVDFEYK